MKNTSDEVCVRVSTSEFYLIIGITDKMDFFSYQKSGDFEYVLKFIDEEKVLDLDDLIKDKLIYQGFDRNYYPNQFGRNCENLIDKFHEVLK